MPQSCQHPIRSRQTVLSEPLDRARTKRTDMQQLASVYAGCGATYHEMSRRPEPTGSSSHYTTKGSLATSFLGAQWDSFASLKRLCRLLSLRSSDFVDYFRFAQATLSITFASLKRLRRLRTHGFFIPLYDKRKSCDFLFGCPVGFEPTTFRTTI